MTRFAKSCLQISLKVVNSVMGLVGIAMIMYGLWVFRALKRDREEIHFDSSPWFVYSLLALGIIFCLITGIGHISADSSNSFCLSCYTVIIWVLLLLETTIAADIFLNSNWEKDLPEDPTGRFHDFKEFVESNFDFFKWVGLLIVLAQGSSILLAMALKALGTNHGCCNYDSDDECKLAAARVSLIDPNFKPSPFLVPNPWIASKADGSNKSFRRANTPQILIADPKEVH